MTAVLFCSFVRKRRLNARKKQISKKCLTGRSIVDKMHAMQVPPGARIIYTQNEGDVDAEY